MLPLPQNWLDLGRSAWNLSRLLSKRSSPFPALEADDAFQNCGFAGKPAARYIAESGACWFSGRQAHRGSQQEERLRKSSFLSQGPASAELSGKMQKLYTRRFCGFNSGVSESF